MAPVSKRRASACLGSAVISIAAFITAAIMVVYPWPADAVQAQAVISKLDCTGNPEMVVLTNQGTDAQDLSGWKLQSDPTASESYDLSAVGSLAPGTSVTIESGPAAAGVFTWSQQEIFRDGDPTDFARVLDNNSSVRQEVACSVAAATPTPTLGPATVTPVPRTTPARTAAATPAPAPTVGNVPDGGGPPGGGAALSPLMIVALGGTLLTAGLGVFALPGLVSAVADRRRGRRRAELPVPGHGALPALSLHSDISGRESRLLLLGLVATVVAYATVSLLRRVRGSRR